MDAAPDQSCEDMSLQARLGIMPSKHTPVRCDMPEAEHEDDILQRLLMQYGDWERAEGWGPDHHHSTVLLIATVDTGGRHGRGR